MDPVIVRFWEYDARANRKSLRWALLIQPSGEFEVVEGHCPPVTLERLRTEPISALPASIEDLAAPPRKVLPKDGLGWAWALCYHYSGRDFWADKPEPPPRGLTVRTGVV